jgi:hypothetical protein
LICCFHSFFLKPLSVTLPFAARFTGCKDNGAVRGSAFETQAKAKTVTAVEGQEGSRWRGF